MKEPQTLEEAQAQSRARAQERVQVRRAEAAANLEAQKESAKRSWLEGGGDEKEFERSWPEMRDSLLADRVRAEQDLAQAQTKAFYQEAF
jgi:hypothetical protein